VPEEERLATFENVPERDESDFFDVLSERNAIKQTIDSGDFRSPNNSMAQKEPTVGIHLTNERNYQNLLSGEQRTNAVVEDSAITTEVSVYAFDSLQSIQDVV